MKNTNRSNKKSSPRQSDTPARQALLQILHEAKLPLTPLMLVRLCHRAGRKVNKTTIYRTLKVWERTGFVRRVAVSDRRQYFELTERGHHHHFICTKCDAIQEVYFTEEVPLLMRIEQLSQKLGFSISSHAMEFYGRCARCQNACGE